MGTHFEHITPSGIKVRIEIPQDVLNSLEEEAGQWDMPGKIQGMTDSLAQCLSLDLSTGRLAWDYLFGTSMCLENLHETHKREIERAIRKGRLQSS